MQIREKNNTRYLVRATYDPARKRAVQAVIGKVDILGEMTLHSGVTLTPQEQEQWAAYWKARQDEQEAGSARYDLRNITRSLDAFLGALEAHPEWVDAEATERHLQAFKAATKKLRQHRAKLHRAAKLQAAQGVPLAMEE